MICPKCKKQCEQRRSGYCKDCTNEYMRNWYRNKKDNPDDWMKKKIQRMFSAAKKRARHQGVAFEITTDDIVIPNTCPVLGIDICMYNKKIAENSPTLDKIIPEKGYVKGNVIVISCKANRIKSNATHNEILMVAEWLKKVERT